MSKKQYKQLFNHDGWCLFQQVSQYQKWNEPVGVDQIKGYVDEVVDSGNDILLLSPTIAKLPLWISDVNTHWQDSKGEAPVKENKPVDEIYNRVKKWMDQGNDLIQIMVDRSLEKKIDFGFSWRMNECHDVRKDGSPIQSKFWRDHPEFRISGPEAKTLFGRALDFSHEEVQQYQLSLIREICTRYQPKFFELDFLRFEKFFPRTVSAEIKKEKMHSFVKQVREILDSVDQDIPLGVRVQTRLDLVERMGLDLKRGVAEGLIDAINIAPFIVTLPDADIEEFREAFPKTTLFGEITHCTHYGRLVQTCVFEDTLINREGLLATAHSFLSRGCDGISTFNYSYMRDGTLGSTPDRVPREPDYVGLSQVRDSERHKNDSKLYLLTDDRYSKQLPVAINVEQEHVFKIHVADDLGDPKAKNQVKKCILRVQATVDSPACDFEALIDEVPLEKIDSIGHIFQSEENRELTLDAEKYSDFEVSVNQIKKGWNEIIVRLISTQDVTIHRLELAIIKN